MPTIAHLSDLHFGAAAPEAVDALVARMAELAPDVVAVSGDLTQRARRRQFLRARRFLDALTAPQVVVPGNHDVPLYNLFARFRNPLRGFRRHITAERYPVFSDPEILVIGADTTRSVTIKDGGLRPEDVLHLSRVLMAAPPAQVRVVVCHHPFDPPVGRAARWTAPSPDTAAVATLVESGADVLLTGHLHLSYVGHTASRYQVLGRAAIVVEAGTATSIRGRGEVNSFNVLRIGDGVIAVERHEWDAQRASFLIAATETFARVPGGWQPSAASAPDR